MATATFHISNFGSFATGFSTHDGGFVRYHVSDRYEGATDDQLEIWTRSRSKAVRNAAWAEINQRRLDNWRSGN